MLCFCFCSVAVFMFSALVREKGSFRSILRYLGWPYTGRPNPDPGARLPSSGPSSVIFLRQMKWPLCGSVSSLQTEAYNNAYLLVTRLEQGLCRCQLHHYSPQCLNRVLCFGSEDGYKIIARSLGLYSCQVFNVIKHTKCLVHIE